MKKILAIVLVTLMVISLAACGEKKDDKKKDTTVAPTTTVDASTSGVITPENLTEGSIGTAMWTTFEEYVTANPDATPDEIATVICENETTLSMGAMPIEPGYLNGLFSEENYVEITDFKSGAMFMPWIGSIPFIGYIFELEVGADVNAFITELETNANPRWNVCVEATETMIGAIDNTVFFVMTPGMYADLT